MAWFNSSTVLSTICTKSRTFTYFHGPFHLPLAHLLQVVFTNMHSLISTLTLVFRHYLWQHVSFAFEDHPSNPAWQCCFDTYSPWEQCNKLSVPWTDTVSQVGNLSCTWGRSHLVFYINNNKCSFHGTSPVLSNHRDLSEAPGKSPVCLPVFFSLPCKSFTRHPPRYLELYLKVMFKVRVHHRDTDLKKLGSRRRVILI